MSAGPSGRVCRRDGGRVWGGRRRAMSAPRHPEEFARGAGDAAALDADVLELGAGQPVEGRDRAALEAPAAEAGDEAGPGVELAAVAVVERVSHFVLQT